MLRGGCALTPEGDFYFGEYIPNDRGTSRSTNTVWRAAAIAPRLHVFRPGEIRHVQSVRFDALTNALWLCAGDFPLEGRIVRTTNSFASPETVGAGDEAWRAIRPFFTARHVWHVY